MTGMATTPLLSIGLPVYNGAKFIRETLDSILNQTFEDFELIITDNASTDQTPQICQEYTQRDARVRYFRHDQNMGAARNHNRAFELARGQYFKWQHYDDLLAATYVERCLEQLNLHPEAVLSFSGTIIINEKGDPGPEYFDHLNLTSPLPHRRWRLALDHQEQGHAFFGVMRTKDLSQTGLFGNFHVPERVLLAEMSLRGQFIELPECLFYRREHAEVSWAKNKNADDFSVWLDARTERKLTMPRWRRLYELLKAIPQARLGWRESLWCYLELLKHGFSHKKWKGLFEDLQKAASWAVKDLSRSKEDPSARHKL